jgi:hypothetical protein
MLRVLSQRFVKKPLHFFPGMTAKARHPEVFEIPGFRVALAIASLPGMTFELRCEFLGGNTRWNLNPARRCRKKLANDMLNARHFSLMLA